MDKKEKVIVFAGDSTTDANKLGTDDHIGTGYVRLVYDSLTAFQPWETYRFVNAGINGNTSRDLLSRWDTDVVENRPDIIFCMIGINDVWRHLDYRGFYGDIVSLGEYEQNIKTMAEKSRAVGKLYFMTPYFMERNKQDEMRVMTERYAAVMRKVADEFSLPLLDIQAVFDKYMEYRPGQSICWDRVHPEKVGAILIAKEILRVFGKEEV